MKRIILSSIYILVFCLMAFAQITENPCQKIKIDAPETAHPNEMFQVSAYFEKESPPSESKFDWIIIKAKEIIKVNNQSTVDIYPKDYNDGESIVILADSLNGKCQNTAMTKIFVAPICALPLTFDEYEKLNWSEEKIHLTDIASQMKKTEFKDSKLTVLVRISKQTSAVEAKNYLLRILNFLSKDQKLEENRIAFLISKSDMQSVRFYAFPKDYNPDFCECFLIRGEDLQEIANLFQTKPVIKNRKN